ncbi:hypothetical protein GQX74_013451 [Glossina fuscipes]|nr:hypothetical protein GQX74_013451 [Glossina fuscipes]
MVECLLIRQQSMRRCFIKRERRIAPQRFLYSRGLNTVPQPQQLSSQGAEKRHFCIDQRLISQKRVKAIAIQIKLKLREKCRNLVRQHFIQVTVILAEHLPQSRLWHVQQILWNDRCYFLFNTDHYSVVLHCCYCFAAEYVAYTYVEEEHPANECKSLKMQKHETCYTYLKYI